mgnify:CR=1 FL=1
MGILRVFLIFVLMTTSRFILIIALLLLSTVNLQSQTHENTIGVRLGYAKGPLLEASLQHEYRFLRRIEADLGVYFDKTYTKSGVCVLHQWRFLLGDKLSWYLGPGLSAGYWDYSIGYHDFGDGGFYVSAGINAGMEYSFLYASLRLTIDARPEFGLYNQPGEDFIAQFALGVRYVF